MGDEGWASSGGKSREKRLAMGLSSILKSGSKTSKKLARKEKRFTQTQGDIGIARAHRDRAAFMEDNQRQKLQLNENLAARGMGFSTHATDQKSAFASSSQRALDTLGENITLAEQGADLANYTIKANKRFESTALIEDILVTAAGIYTGAGALGGMGGAGAAKPPSGTSGLSQAFLG
jgi:hypothetical protein